MKRSDLQPQMTDGAGRPVAAWLATQQSAAFLRQSIACGERTAECWAELATRAQRVQAAMRAIHGIRWGAEMARLARCGPGPAAPGPRTA